MSMEKLLKVAAKLEKIAAKLEKVAGDRFDASMTFPSNTRPPVSQREAPPTNTKPNPVEKNLLAANVNNIKPLFAAQAIARDRSKGNLFKAYVKVGDYIFGAVKGPAIAWASEGNEALNDLAQDQFRSANAFLSQKGLQSGLVYKAVVDKLAEKGVIEKSARSSVDSLLKLASRLERSVKKANKEYNLFLVIPGPPKARTVPCKYVKWLNENTVIVEIPGGNKFVVSPNLIRGEGYSSTDFYDNGYAGLFEKYKEEEEEEEEEESAGWRSRNRRAGWRSRNRRDEEDFDF